MNATKIYPSKNKTNPSGVKPCNKLIWTRRINTWQVDKREKSYQSQITCALVFAPDWLTRQYLHFDRLETFILQRVLQTIQKDSANFRQSYLQYSNHHSLRLFFLLLIKLTCAEGGALLCLVLLRSPESPKPLNTAPIRLKQNFSSNLNQLNCERAVISNNWLTYIHTWFIW